MESPTDSPETVDEYIARFPPRVRAKLKKLRQVIRTAAPGVEERIAYRMPAFRLNGDLVFFAAFERHIGFYALPGALVAFKDKLKEYKSAKGSVQFPIDEELPYDLIEEIVRFRIEENEERAAAKKAGAEKAAVKRAASAEPKGSASKKGASSKKPR